MSRPFYALIATALFASAVVGVGGCASENLQDLSGSDVLACDTSAVATYSGVIRPLIQRNGCLDCHASGGLGTLATGFNYETAVGLQNANRAGKLIPAIERTGPFPMPKDRPKISDCDIARVKQWVRRGAPND